MRVERVDLTHVLGRSPGYAYAAVVREGDHVYTAGAVPLDTEGNLIGGRDLDAQTRAALSNLEITLHATGVSAEDVVKTTLFVVGEQADLATVWSVFETSELAAAPSTLVGVRSLGYHGQLVEIEAIALARPHPV